ncbi:hypothetical protein V6N13_100432 [Hibiscus sabdariffa]
MKRGRGELQRSREKSEEDEVGELKTIKGGVIISEKGPCNDVECPIKNRAMEDISAMGFSKDDFIVNVYPISDRSNFSGKSFDSAALHSRDILIDLKTTIKGYWFMAGVVNAVRRSGCESSPAGGYYLDVGFVGDPRMVVEFKLEQSRGG